MKKDLFLLAGVLFVITIATAFMILLLPMPKEEADLLAEKHFAEREKALKALRRGNYVLAEESLTRIRRQWPRDRSADRLLIRLYFETGRLDLAEKKIRLLLRHDPENGILLNALGCVCWARRDFRRSEALLRRAAARETTAAGILLNLAMLQQSRGKSTSAQKFRNAASLLVMAGIAADTDEMVLISRYRVAPRPVQDSQELMLKGIPEVWRILP